MFVDPDGALGHMLKSDLRGIKISLYFNIILYSTQF